jgi:hypothetical protein
MADPTLTSGGVTVTLYSTNPYKVLSNPRIAKHDMPGRTGDHHQYLNAANTKLIFGGNLYVENGGATIITSLDGWYYAGQGLNGTALTLTWDIWAGQNVFISKLEYERTPGMPWGTYKYSVELTVIP